MTTVVDPLGTPTIIYNRSGVAVVSVDAANSPLNPIPRVCGWMVVLATPIESSPQIELPDDGEIGDLVEVHALNSTYQPFNVRAPAGESILRGGQVTYGYGRLFRKVSSTQWAAVGAVE